MRNECNIIRDILPLYIDEMVSEDTVSFVEEHLEKCAACRTELENMKAPNALEIAASDTQANDEKPLKAFAKKWNIICKVISFIMFIIMLISILCAVTVTGSGFLDLSNIARYFFIGIAVVCGIIAGILWKASTKQK